MVTGCGRLDEVPLGEMSWYIRETLVRKRDEKALSRYPCGKQHGDSLPLIKHCDRCATLLGAKW
jgi:hypothetical protein